MKSDANSRHFITNLTTARMCVKKGILGINFDQLSVYGLVGLKLGYRGAAAPIGEKVL